jgi:hypothetical protein
MRYLLTLLCFLAPLALADDVAVPNTLSNNSVADADAVQQNFQTLVDESNENDQRLDDAEASVDTLESYFPADSTAALSTGGWYTIAYRPPFGLTEAAAYFMLRNDTSGIRQVTVIYASIAYSRGDVKVLQNRAYTQMERGFTAVRIRKGATYDPLLLQVQVTVNPNSQLDQSVVARLMGRELSRDNAGWIQTDWVPDGDPIDSVDYSLLTAEITKSIPKQVQYLSDFDCTEGQVIEWDDTLGQWECADNPASPSTMVWVDADGNEFINGGHWRDSSGYDDFAVGLYKFPESNYAFKVLELRRNSNNTSLVGSILYYESDDCTGQAFLQQFGASVYPQAGRNASNWIVPDLETSSVSIAYNSYFSFSGVCYLAFSQNINYVYPGNVSSAPLSVSERPPYSLQWR